MDGIRPSNLPTAATTNVSFVLEREPPFNDSVPLKVFVDVYSYSDHSPEAAEAPTKFRYRVYGQNALGDGAKSAFVAEIPSESSGLSDGEIAGWRGHHVCSGRHHGIC